MSLPDLFSRKSKEEEFWDWFAKNDKRLFNFETDQERIFDELHGELIKIHESLVFEISRMVKGKREFVISADGIIDAFPFVESLFNAAPTMEKWTFIKFRPRLGTGFVIKLNDRKVSADDMSFILERVKYKIGIELFIDGYTQDSDAEFRRIAYILLDTALGEYDVETKIGYIDVAGPETNTSGKSYPFSKLPETFDRVYASTSN